VRELILNFHGLGEPHPSVDARELQVWWGIAPFRRLLDCVQAHPLGAGPKISITFDDGNASDALVALPELARRSLAATFFVCAGRIGKTHYLDKPMLDDLLAAGMRVGSHGMHHRNWRSLDEAELDLEIGDGRRSLEDVIQRPVDLVSIPFGAYDRRVWRRLRREPWQCVYTSDGGTVDPGAQVKGRASLRANMQGREVIAELLLSEHGCARAGRALSRLYKRLR
jgi:peptidoglycan/xylan/chitin deacetylase (PgdA/CDA1 family)